MTNKYSAEYRVSLYDAGPGGALKIPALFNYFQGITGDHATAIGFSGEDILRRGYHWMISRYRLSVTRLPYVTDKFTITTWRSGENGHFAIREFLITDEKENILMQATSSWALIDYMKRIPVRSSDFLPGYPINPERALDDSFPSVPEVASPDFEKEFSVRRCDLDMNKHVNNSIYTSWMLETGEDLNDGKTIKDISINFKKETRYGDRVISLAEHDPASGRLVHKLINKETGKELTRGITVWA